MRQFVYCWQSAKIMSLESVLDMTMFSFVFLLPHLDNWNQSNNVRTAPPPPPPTSTIPRPPAHLPTKRNAPPVRPPPLAESIVSQVRDVIVLERVIDFVWFSKKICIVLVYYPNNKPTYFFSFFLFSNMIATSTSCTSYKCSSTTSTTAATTNEHIANNGCSKITVTHFECSK